MPAPPTPPTSSLLAATPTFEAARRLGESLVIAAVTSSGLYLVGAVYTDAYYGRLSIETTSLDLSPPYVALQSAHALRALLEYPSTLLLLWVLYRTFAAPARRLRGWFDRARRRFPRLLLVAANAVVVAPLVVGAFLAAEREQTLVPGSLLSEVASLLEDLGVLLLLYAVWLGWSQRASIVSQIRARKPIPIALVFSVYLLSALAATATAAERAAALLLTGGSDASIGIELTMAPGADQQVAGKELILVSARNGTFFVVERQAAPPSQRPVAYMIPATAVDVARVQRLVDADATFDEFVLDGIE
ncbi:MAG: hypothetical protein H0U10_17490 [Chloroflexia bacterium]|nr:hypothetical protein [Chloroflexia bacterium]